MKTWLKYLAAVAAGLSVVLIFRDSALFFSITEFCSNVLLKLGVFLVIPMVFFSMMSSTASLRRRKGMAGRVWAKIVIWDVLIVFILSVFAATVFYLVPAKFPVTSSAGTQNNLQNTFVNLNQGLVKMVFSIDTNSFSSLVSNSGSLIPIVFIAFILGYAMKPSTDIIRPAYAVTNSISEVFMKIARFLTVYGWIFIFFVSMNWFSQIWKDGSIFVSLRFLFVLVLLLGTAMFGLIPLIYSLFTGFKENPYKQIIRLLGTSVAGLVSGNILFALPSTYSLGRNNLGIQKKILNTTIPVSTIIGRGGTAMASAITVLSLIYGSTGEIPPYGVLITIALGCGLVSFFSSLHLGYEVLFVSVFTLALLQIDLWGAEAAVIALMPVLNGVGIMFDSVLAGLGASYVAKTVNADCNIRQQDIL